MLDYVRELERSLLIRSNLTSSSPSARASSSDVNETAGDGLMVIFHEGDHARAAVAAAQGIHRRADELNLDAAGGAGPLAMHIRVGLTINIAARLAGW